MSINVVCQECGNLMVNEQGWGYVHECNDIYLCHKCDWVWVANNLPLPEPKFKDGDKVRFRSNVTFENMLKCGFRGPTCFDGTFKVEKSYYNPEDCRVYYGLKGVIGDFLEEYFELAESRYTQLIRNIIANKSNAGKVFLLDCPRVSGKTESVKEAIKGKDDVLVISSRWCQDYGLDYKCRAIAPGAAIHGYLNKLRGNRYKAIILDEVCNWAEVLEKIKPFTFTCPVIIIGSNIEKNLLRNQCEQDGFCRHVNATSDISNAVWNLVYECWDYDSPMFYIGLNNIDNVCSYPIRPIDKKEQIKALIDRNKDEHILDKVAKILFGECVG